MEHTLKGEKFVNRYRITGKLKTRSPLHIGTGETKPVEKKTKKKGGKKEGKEKIADKKKDEAREKDNHDISCVARDHRGKPLIPGTALKGVMRHWLLHVFHSLGTDWAIVRDFNAKEYENLSQEDQHNEIKGFSRLELILGTPFNEGKVEVWDATCSTTAAPVSKAFLNWNSELLTYVTTSVAINPETGTAQEHLLYNNEVVPPGVEFDLTLVGQNLDPIELGIVLFALEGFNSSIYPMQLGARNGVGYGLMEYVPGPMYRLDQTNIRQWMDETIEHLGNGASGEKEPVPLNAGYYALEKLDAEDQKTLIKDVKAQLINAIAG